MNSAKPSKAGNFFSSLLISKINYDASLSDLPRIILSLALSREIHLGFQKLLAKTENLPLKVALIRALKARSHSGLTNSFSPFEEKVHVKLGINPQIFTV